MRLQITRTLAPPRPPHRQFLPIPAIRGEASGLYEGEPEACRRSFRAFVPIFVHLGLLLAVFNIYHLEYRPFRTLVTLCLASMPVHYLLPMRLKKPFFVGLTGAGLAILLGPAAAAVVLAIGVALIALARMPVAWPARIAALAAAAIGLVLLRGEAARFPTLDVALPVVGSLFMFRMILYLYELKHAEGPETLGDALAYFFLLPNVYFIHFPVVDYRAFRRGYFAKDIHAIQADGLRMMVRGTVHLLLYRLIDQKLLIAAEEVHNLPSLVGFIVCTYLLYLRVSGQFHVACGMLQLFGFSLPETHHNYLLASSFTDYWRRINIYWKDFMVRVVFNPVVFRLKRWPQPLAFAAATASVFAVTWFLHAYQLFWRHGTWGFSVPDALFWGILGTLVMINVQVDARSPRRPKPRDVGVCLKSLAIRSAKTAATFATVAILWSLWSSPSLGAWVNLLRRAAG